MGITHLKDRFVESTMTSGRKGGERIEKIFQYLGNLLIFGCEILRSMKKVLNRKWIDCHSILRTRVRIDKNTQAGQHKPPIGILRVLFREDRDDRCIQIAIRYKTGKKGVWVPVAKEFVHGFWYTGAQNF